MNFYGTRQDQTLQIYNIAKLTAASLCCTLLLYYYLNNVLDLDIFGGKVEFQILKKMGSSGDEVAQPHIIERRYLGAVADEIGGPSRAAKIWKVSKQVAFYWKVKRKIIRIIQN